MTRPFVSLCLCRFALIFIYKRRKKLKKYILYSLCQTKDQDPDWKDSQSVCPLLHMEDLYVNEG